MSRRGFDNTGHFFAFTLTPRYTLHTISDVVVTVMGKKSHALALIGQHDLYCSHAGLGDLYRLDYANLTLSSRDYQPVP